MTYSQKANPNATNSELDSKRIITHKELTPSQKYDLISQYCEIVVDGMDYKSLEQYAHEQMTNYFDNLILSEIKEEIDNHDPELYDELVDNVTNEIAQPKVTITPQELEGDISTITDDDYDTFSDKVVTCEELEKQSIKHYDDDYADKVDTLVGNMVASDDNVFTHDSEGC